MVRLKTCDIASHFFSLSVSSFCICCLTAACAVGIVDVFCVYHNIKYAMLKAANKTLCDSHSHIYRDVGKARDQLNGLLLYCVFSFSTTFLSQLHGSVKKKKTDHCKQCCTETRRGMQFGRLFRFVYWFHFYIYDFFLQFLSLSQPRPIHCCLFYIYFINLQPHKPFAFNLNWFINRWNENEIKGEKKHTQRDTMLSYVYINRYNVFVECATNDNAIKIK